MDGTIGIYMNKNISSLEIINFLKDKNLYCFDNGVYGEVKFARGLDNSAHDSISWIKNSSYNLDHLKSQILLVCEDFNEVDSSRCIIYTKDPKLAMAYVLNAFLNVDNLVGISNTASVDISADIGQDVYIGDNVVIGKKCVLGNNSMIYSNTVIYPNTIIGSNVIINAGAKIGQEGFGYIKDENGNFMQFPHIGRVIIGDNVEIGANTCIDRGALLDTIICKNTKIDNLCHVAHNVKIGNNCLVAAGAEISGSVVIGDNVYIGPKSSIIDGIVIGDGVTIGIGAIVRRSVKEGDTIVPFESMSKRDYIKKRKALNDISNR